MWGASFSVLFRDTLVLALLGQRHLSVSCGTACFPQLPLEDELPAVPLAGPRVPYCSLLGECHFSGVPRGGREHTAPLPKVEFVRLLLT